MRAQKVERLFYIIKYLDNHDTVTAGEIAKHCQTSVRSIYRDMKVLEELGFYFTNEGRHGYKLINKAVQIPKNITIEEWMAITLFPLLSRNITYEKHPFHLAYRSGLEKIRKNVLNNKGILSISSQIGERILFQDQYREANCPNIMREIIEAIAHDRSIRIKYYSIYRNALSDRIIDPYYLIPRRGHLYLIAFCHYRSEVRVFRLNRIRSIEETEQSFVIPKTFDIVDFLENRWSIIADEDEPITFSVRFNKEIARYVYEYDFYSETSLEEQEDGSLLLKTTVKSKIEFLKWIRSFGLNAEVIEPVEIRNELMQEYEELFRRYKNENQFE